MPSEFFHMSFIVGGSGANSPHPEGLAVGDAPLAMRYSNGHGATPYDHKLPTGCVGCVLMLFLEKINSFHPTIEFSAECSRESITFLDTTVIHGGNRLVTDL